MYVYTYTHILNIRASHLEQFGLGSGVEHKRVRTKGKTTALRVFPSRKVLCKIYQFVDCVVVKLRRTILLVTRGGGLGSRPKKIYGERLGEWGRVPFNETYAPSLSTIYDGA